MSAHPAIEVQALTKRYKRTTHPAIEGVSLQVNEGEIFGLLGPNGAGKTTLLSILCGLRTYDSGSVQVCGYSLKTQLKTIKSLMGVVPQDIALYPTLTAQENLRIFGGLFGLRGALLEERIHRFLTLFGLEESKHRCLKTYSGGMKRRINLIAGLLHEPRLLFLDEPTVGVDVHSRNLIIENLKSIHATGATIIYTSHYLDEAEHLCSQIALMDKGNIICRGTPEEITKTSGGYASLESVYLQLTGKKVQDA